MGHLEACCKESTCCHPATTMAPTLLYFYAYLAKYEHAFHEISGWFVKRAFFVVKVRFFTGFSLWLTRVRPGILSS